VRSEYRVCIDPTGRLSHHESLTAQCLDEFVLGHVGPAGDIGLLRALVEVGSREELRRRQSRSF
jgi:hypothetical protein